MTMARKSAALVMAALPAIVVPATASAQNPWDVTPTGIGMKEQGSNVLLFTCPSCSKTSLSGPPQ